MGVSGERVRIGVIGLGLMGASHAATLRRLDECELVAVSDIDERHQETARTLGVGFYRDYKEMIEKERLQGVLIVVPNHLHVPIGIACSREGIHLFVEKPIAPSLSEADRLIESAKENGVYILVGHQRRFSGLVEKAREIVLGGELGALVGVTVTWALFKPSAYFEGPFAWRKEKGGGPILINLIHEIDDLRYICGEIDRVYALVSCKARKFPVEDTASVALRFENGALGTIFLSDCTPSMTSWEATTGENPLVYHDLGNCCHFFGTEASLVFPQMKKLYYSDRTHAGWNYPIAKQGVDVVREDPYVKEFRHFFKVILGEESPRTSGEDGRRTLEVTLAVLQSGETGQPVALI